MICTFAEYCLGDLIKNNEERVTWHEWGREDAPAGVLVGKPEGKEPLGRPRRGW